MPPIAKGSKRGGSNGGSSSGGAGQQISFGGWLTTKKRGRDDDAIERDKAAALEARRRKKKKKEAAGGGKGRGGAGGGRKKKKRQDDDDWIADDEEEEEEESFSEEEDGDDEASLEEFIVDDDEDEDEDLEVDGASSSDDEDEDDEDGMDESFMPKAKKRTSRVRPLPQVLERANRAGKQQRKPPPAAGAAAAAASRTKSRVTKRSKYFADKSDESDRKPPAKEKKGRGLFEELSSDSDDGSSGGQWGEIKSDSKHVAAAAKKPGEIGGLLVEMGDTSDDDDPFLSPPAFGKRGAGGKHAAAAGNEETSMQKNSSSSSSSSKNNGKKSDKHALEDSDSDERSASSDEEAEDTALAWALKESMKHASQAERGTVDLTDRPPPKDKKKRSLKRIKGKKEKKKKKSTNLDSLHSLEDLPAAPSRSRNKSKSLGSLESDGDQEEEPIIDLVESDDDNDDEQDDYVDEGARAAGSVLEQANRLSAQVLQTMMQWTSASKGTGDSSGNDATASSVPVGMIVDGALSLATTQQDSKVVASSSSSSIGGNAAGSSGKHEYITQDEIRKLCPGLTLSDYQLIGVNWLALLDSMKCKVQGANDQEIETPVNGVLADEMGLGKTVQTIAFLAWLAYKKRGKTPHSHVASATTKKGACKDEPIVLESDAEADDADHDFGESREEYRACNHGKTNSTLYRPHLVVAPASVVSNWEREFEIFAPHLRVVRYHGSQLERSELRNELDIYLPKNEYKRKRQGVEPIDVLLTSVTYFQTEKSDDRAFLRKFKYDYMVVDEAHMLKNAQGTRYKSLDKFDTGHRLLLTGTPVQNNPKELMCLLCFLMPLFSRKSSGYYDDDDSKNNGGEHMLEHFVSLEGQKGLADEAAAYRKLKQLFAPFVLRRKKADVLSQIMPPKERKVEFVQLDDVARSLYNSIISDHIKAKKCTNEGGSYSQEHLFTQLRKAAHHPLLIRSRYKSPSEKAHLAKVFHQYGAFRGEGCTREKVMQELERWNDFDIHLTALELKQENPHRGPELEQYILTEEDLFRSAKFVRLRTLLPELIGAGHRILIFDVWTSCLDLLSCLMENLGIGCLRMDGSTPVGERQSLIDRFNRDTSIPVFLLSTKACGLGINLTAADVCIMFGQDFNPFNDLQAEDRCHRIGQKKKVTVFKMVAAATVDEDIYAMQERKAKMNAAIMESNNGDSGNGTSSKKFNAAAEKDAVLSSAVARFLSSPDGANPQRPAQHPPPLPLPAASAPPSSPKVASAGAAEESGEVSEKENRNRGSAALEMTSEI